MKKIRHVSVFVLFSVLAFGASTAFAATNATTSDFYSGAINAENVGSALANGPETIDTGATQSAIVDGVITVSGAIRPKDSNVGTFEGSAAGPAIAQYLVIPAGSARVEESKTVGGVTTSLGFADLNTDPANPDRGWFDYTKGVFRMGVYLYSGDALRNGDISLNFVFKNDVGTVLKDINYTLRFVTTAAVVATNASTSTVTLGLAGDYAIFANTGIHTDAGASVITGDIGTGPGVTSTTITGFALTLPAASTYSTSAQVTGKVYAFDYAPPTPTNVNTASLDMGTAYTDAFTRTPGVGTFLNVGGGTVTGKTLVAGVYTWTSAVTIPTDLTLSGSATDVWIFQVNGALDMAAAKTVHLTGGALPQNVFWEVTGAVNIGADTHFEGNILGKTSITFGRLSSILGRLLAQTAVTLDMTTVTVPTSASVDTTAPVITLKGVTPNIGLGSTYTELGATALDNVDGSFAATPSGSVNTAVVGSYVITYTATDTAGNTATTTRTINVVRTNNGEGGGGGGSVGVGVYHPAIPATPAVPGVSPAIPATPAVPAKKGEVLGESTFNFNRGLALGSRSDDVTELQNRLTAEGVYFGPITGYFGSLTAQGVKNLQKKYGLSQVGVVGPQTRARLNSGVAVGTGSENEIPGCAIGNKFNTTTGQSCPVQASSGQGCAVGNKFSTTTGLSCPVQ